MSAEDQLLRDIIHTCAKHDQVLAKAVWVAVESYQMSCAGKINWWCSQKRGATRRQARHFGDPLLLWQRTRASMWVLHHGNSEGMIVNTWRSVGDAAKTHGHIELYCRQMEHGTQAVGIFLSPYIRYAW